MLRHVLLLTTVLVSPACTDDGTGSTIDGSPDGRLNGNHQIVLTRRLASDGCADPEFNVGNAVATLEITDFTAKLPGAGWCGHRADGSVVELAGSVNPQTGSFSLSCQSSSDVTSSSWSVGGTISAAGISGTASFLGTVRYDLRTVTCSASFSVSG